MNLNLSNSGLMQAQNDTLRSQEAINSEFLLAIRGKHFSTQELEVIFHCIDEHFDEGRTKISLAICEELNWKQPNGWPKDRACRDVLLRLERMGLITLPPSRAKKTTNSTTRSKTANYSSEYDLVSPITRFPDNINLEFAKGDKAERIWNEIIKQYHYLGHEVLVGRCIKYLVTSEDKLLGALAFSSPAWRLGPRDSLLQLLGIDTNQVGDYVISNSRFLILPNVRVKNLASAILSLATSKIVADWNRYYALKPQVVETFVLPSRFSGTCYRAANWIEVGLTKGYAKKGNTYHNSQEPKQIFLYGLNRSMRRKMLKAVSDKKKYSE